MDKGLILVIIGGLLSCTIYGVLIGAPLTLIGAYFGLNQNIMIYF